MTIVHLGTAAVWVGAMAYSLTVVQPRAERLLGDRYEAFAAELAAGARWKVLGMAAVLGGSGAGLVIAELAGEPDPSAAWAALVVAKGVLLLAAVALFAYVSWRLWPARVFALPDELGAVRERFRTAALGLTALVSLGLVLGAIADVTS